MHTPGGRPSTATRWPPAPRASDSIHRPRPAGRAPRAWREVGAGSESARAVGTPGLRREAVRSRRRKRAPRSWGSGRPVGARLRRRPTRRHRRTVRVVFHPPPFRDWPRPTRLVCSPPVDSAKGSWGYRGAKVEGFASSTIRSPPRRVGLRILTSPANVGGSPPMSTTSPRQLPQPFTIPRQPGEGEVPPRPRRTTPSRSASRCVRACSGYC